MANAAGLTVTPNMKTGGTSPAPKGGKAVGTVGLTGMSPGQFAKYVNSTVNGMYGPELGALQNYQGGMNKLFGSEMNEAGLGSQELAQMLSQIAPAVKQNYTDAANTDAGFAKGFQDALGSTTPGVNPGVGSVLGTMFGLIPGQSLAQQGAGFESAADMLPQTAGGLGRAASDAIAGAQSKFDLGAQEKLATLLGDMGKAKLTVGNDLQSQADRLATERLSQARLQESVFNSNRHFGLSVAEFNQRTTHEAQMLGLSKAKFAYEQRHAAAVQSRLSQNDMTRLYENATKAADLMYTGKRGEEEILPNGQKTYVGGSRQYTYQQAVNALMQEFPGLGPQGATGIANSHYKPGERGRPANAGINNEYWTTDPAGNNYNYSVPGGLSPQARHQVDGILSLAHEYLGTPYAWGGESPKGFDCSGLAQFIYGKVGISIPRRTYEQWTDPHAASVSKQAMMPGDLVYYKGSDSIVQNGRLLPGHVGIYIGHGLVIDSFGTGYGVRIDPVFSPALGGFMGARRWEKVQRTDTPQHPNG